MIFLVYIHTYVMIPVIWSGTILLVAFITTTSYCYDQNGWTAMILAAAYGHKDIVEYLVSQGADKDIKTDVSTPLVHVHLYKMKYMHMYMYVYTYIYIYIYMWISFATCILFCIHITISMHKCVYMYKIMVWWLSVCMYVCVYYVYMFALLFLKIDVYHDNKKPSSWYHMCMFEITYVWTWWSDSWFR